MTNPAISTTNNRFASGQGYSYDASGNTTADALARTFVYDAENKQIEVIENSVSIGKYYYDGDGKRIKKISANETVIFIYDASGKLVAEYANQTSQTPKISYLTNDHLGSPRITTDELGQVISRRDFMPFGEEIYRPNYDTDSVRQKFTGYERDDETGLDFAQARMYSKNHGRFSTVDPTLKSVRFDEPQTWNRYLYVTNNPLRFTDPLGLWRLQAYHLYTEEEYEEDGETKKRYVYQGTMIFATRSKEGDDAASLLDQLGIDKNSTNGKTLLESIGDRKNFRLSSLGGEVGESYGFFESAITAQNQWTNSGKANGPPLEGYGNCAETCTRLAFPGIKIDLDKIQSSPEYADKFYKKQKNITQGETKFLDAVRYADGENTGTHFANMIFKTDNGNLQVFSRSGIQGRFEILDATSLQGSSYGTIRGIGKDKTGYYSRTEKRK